MFELKKVTDLKNYNGKGFLYVHDKTGMEVFHVRNNSEELSACFMFATPSEDSTGVAHILEHTVLAGSGLYPVKDPFFQVYNSSPNTFLNAMTYTDKTVYPFASPLKKDFDILFSIYADAVFNPLLRKESFEQEGIRFFENHFDGVVFNEMVGAFSNEDAILQEKCLQKLYEGTAAQYVSGGDPDFIPDLSYEEYLARYRKWYSPSNCRLFLFGDLNADEYLKIIEDRYLGAENLFRWEMGKIVPSWEKYGAISPTPTKLNQFCSTEDASSTVVAWLTKPASDPVDILTIELLADILIGGPGSPLYDAIIDSDLGEDMSPASGVDTDFPLMPFIVGFNGTGKNSDEKIEEFILKTLKKIVSEGIDSTLIDGVIRRQEFKIQEIPDTGIPLGLSAALKSAKTWLRGCEPDEILHDEENLDALKEKISQGKYFENWIEKNIIENNRRCLVTIKYSPDYESERKAVLDFKLKKRLSEVDPVEFENDKKKYSSFSTSVDSPELLATIPRVTISDLPERIPKFEIEDSPFYGAKLIENTMFTNGITYIDMAFDLSSLTEEEFDLLPLLVRLLQMCGTKKHNFKDMSNLLRLYTGSFTLQSVFGTKPNGATVAALYLRTKVLNRYTQQAFSLIDELLNRYSFTQERIKASLTDLITDFESSFHDEAYYFASLKGQTVFSKTAFLRDKAVGIGGYLNFLNMQGKNLKTQLERLASKIFNANGLTLQLSCDSPSLDSAKEISAEFVKKLNKFEIANNLDSINTAPNRFRLVETASGPAYNSRIFFPGKMSEQQLAFSSVLTGTLSNGFLWEKLRTVGGAYGAMCNTDMQESLVSMTSYRDPNIEKTYKVYSDALDQTISAEDIEHLVVLVIGKELKPMAPKSRAQETLRRHLFGMTDAMYLERRKSVLNATSNDLLEISNLLKSGSFTDVTICSKDLAKTLTSSPTFDSSNLEIIDLPL